MNELGSIAFRLLPRRSVARSAAAILVGSIAVFGLVVPAAWADAGCATRSQTITAVFAHAMDYEFQGRTYNTSCSSKDLEEQIRHDDVFGRDDVIASSNWSNLSGTYERYIYGCRNGTATYFSRQRLDGTSEKKSSYRKFQDCRLA